MSAPLPELIASDNIRKPAESLRARFVLWTPSLMPVESTNSSSHWRFRVSISSLKMGTMRSCRRERPQLSPLSTDAGSPRSGIAISTDPDPPRIRILDDFGRILLGGASVKEGCGQRQYGIAVIDTDGTVTKNDTLKSTYEGADRFEKRLVCLQGRLSELASSPEFVEYANFSIQQVPFANACSLLSRLWRGNASVPMAS